MIPDLKCTANQSRYSIALNSLSGTWSFLSKKISITSMVELTSLLTRYESALQETIKNQNYTFLLKANYYLSFH